MGLELHLGPEPLSPLPVQIKNFSKKYLPTATSHNSTASQSHASLHKSFLVYGNTFGGENRTRQRTNTDLLEILVSLGDQNLLMVDVTCFQVSSDAGHLCFSKHPEIISFYPKAFENHYHSDLTFKICPNFTFWYLVVE